jgi:hypothetical protein
MASPFGTAFRTIAVDRMAERPINNAALLGTRLYRSDLYLFDDWLASQGGDLTRAVLLLQRLLEDAEGEQAFERMRRILDAQRRTRSTMVEPIPAESTTTPPLPVPR